jgi:tetratricopeptide (TPR) repeat protein
LDPKPTHKAQQKAMRNGRKSPRLTLFSLSLTALLLISGEGTCFGMCRHIHAIQGDALQAALEALQNNRLEEALRGLNVAEREQPLDARIRNFRGIVLVRMGRTSEAADEYREATRLDPKLEDAYKNLGYLEWTEHRLQSAQASLQRALELAPDDSFAHYYLGRVQLDAGLYESAFQELERSGVEWPADPQFLVAAANGYLKLQRHEKAREVLARLSTSSLTDNGVAVVARLLTSAGDHGGAADLLRRFTDHSPGAPRWAQLDLALSYLAAGNFEKAAAQSQKLVEAPASAGAPAQDLASAWSVMGIAKARGGQAHAAVDAFRRAAKLDSVREEHWLNLTRQLMEMNRSAEAILAAQEALTSNPESYALHLRLGAAYLASDRYSEAESIFRKLVAAGDPLPTSYVGLAQVLLRTGRAEEAVSELAAASKKLEANFLISYFLGLALNRAARPAEAIPAFQEAIRLNPGSSEAHLGLGKTELLVGHNNEAITELQKCLQLNPNNVNARRLLIQAYGRTGDTQAALRYSQEIPEREAAPQNDLLGDFISPEWQSPQEHAQQ